MANNEVWFTDYNSGNAQGTLVGYDQVNNYYTGLLKSCRVNTQSSALTCATNSASLYASSAIMVHV